jgi:uncharacterized coiled-coil protein SlyX
MSGRCCGLSIGGSNAVSGETVTLELVGARLLALNAEVRDLQQRFTAMETRLGVLEARFSGLEARFAAQEERMTRLIALVLRIAERLGAPQD